MFLFVNSLESLLTVKAVDGLDPFRRKANSSADLAGLAAGNALSGLLGGLPMISEVVRSSANGGVGVKTKWANFFHGVFLLAAMLIYAGFRLASPKEFKHVYEIGKEQLVIFIVTILITLLEDLLLGVAAGIVVKMIFHLTRGISVRDLFKVQSSVKQDGSTYRIAIQGAAVFTNILGHQRVIDGISQDAHVGIDLSEAVFIDHSFIDFLHRKENEFQRAGGTFSMTGLECHQPLSNHPHAARKFAK